VQKITRPPKGKLEHVTIVKILTACRLYSNTKEIGLKTFIENGVRSEQKAPRLTHKGYPTNELEYQAEHYNNEERTKEMG